MPASCLILGWLSDLELKLKAQILSTPGAKVQSLLLFTLLLALLYEAPPCMSVWRDCVPLLCTLEHLSRVGGTERGVCGICVARACAPSGHADDTDTFPESTFLLCQNQGFSRHWCVICVSERERKKNTYTPLRSPPH